jgi:hypothetical protein
MNFVNYPTKEVTKEHLIAAEWQEVLVCECLGMIAKIRSAKPEFFAELLKNLPDNFKKVDVEDTNSIDAYMDIFVTQTSEQETIFFFYDKLVPLLKYLNGYPTLEENIWSMGEFLNAFNAWRNDNYIIIHAGAVVVNGKSIIFPANSYSGKSSLTAEFVRQGAKYFSDEYAVISEDGFLHPFHKKISLREPGSYDQTDVSVESLGGQKSHDAMLLDYILFTKFTKYSRWKPEVLSKARAVFDLLPHAINGKNNPEFTIRVLQNAVKNATILRSSRGESANFVKGFLKTHDFWA